MLKADLIFFKSNALISSWITSSSLGGCTGIHVWISTSRGSLILGDERGITCSMTDGIQVLRRGSTGGSGAFGFGSGTGRGTICTDFSVARDFLFEWSVEKVKS